MEYLMKYYIVIFFVSFFICLQSIGYSENLEEVKSSEFKEEEMEEIIVTATRTETPVSQLADSVTIISREQIEQQKATTVFETLRSVPGLSIRKSGSIGRQTEVTIRGSSTSQVLVMIDGIQVNSPTTGTFEFANLTTDNIERIEVVRGPQSTLYGSDAMGGLVNIITRKGKGKPKFSIRSEFGTPERTYNESIR